GPDGGKEAEGDPHGRAEDETDHGPFHGHADVEVREDGDQIPEQEPDHDPEDAADVAEDHRLEEELGHDAHGLGAQRLLDPDLLGPLGHGHQHDVHDPDPGHD